MSATMRGWLWGRCGRRWCWGEVTHIAVDGWRVGEAPRVETLGGYPTQRVPRWVWRRTHCGGCPSPRSPTRQAGTRRRLNQPGRCCPRTQHLRTLHRPPCQSPPTRHLSRHLWQAGPCEDRIIWRHLMRLAAKLRPLIHRARAAGTHPSPRGVVRGCRWPPPAHLSRR